MAPAPRLWTIRQLSLEKVRFNQSHASITATVPAGAQILDLKGYTVLPGLVGMHDHMFFPMGGNPPMYSNMGTSFPRLYLALGVTTIRTTGSVAPYTDLEIKRLIDAGRMIGPKMHITAPYLEGVGSFTPVMHTLTGPDDARRMVNFPLSTGSFGGGLLRRRLAQRTRGPHRLRSSFRAHDVPGFRKRAQGRALSVRLKRRRHDERDDFE